MTIVSSESRYVQLHKPTSCSCATAHAGGRRASYTTTPIYDSSVVADYGIVSYHIFLRRSQTEKGPEPSRACLPEKGVEEDPAGCGKRTTHASRFRKDTGPSHRLILPAVSMHHACAWLGFELKPFERDQSASAASDSIASALVPWSLPRHAPSLERPAKAAVTGRGEKVANDERGVDEHYTTTSSPSSCSSDFSGLSPVPRSLLCFALLHRSSALRCGRY